MKRSRIPTLHHDSAREPRRKSRATAKNPPCELGRRHCSESAKQNDRRALRYWQAHEKVMHAHHEALPCPNATSRFHKRATTEVPCYGKESSLRNAANRCVGHAHHEALPCPNATSRFRKRATTEVPCYGKESSLRIGKTTLLGVCKAERQTRTPVSAGTRKGDACTS